MFLDPINLRNWAWWIKKYSTPALLSLLSLHCGDNHSVGVAEYLVGGEGDLSPSPQARVKEQRGTTTNKTL